MARFEWSRILKQHVGTGSQSRCNGARVSRTRFLPRLDPMEARTLLSTLLVSNLSDSGTGSLRAAIATPGNGNIIDFAHGLHGTITLASDLPITHGVTINGPGANRVSVSGNDANRIFDISGNASVSIGGLTITDGLATAGGGILLEGSAALNLSNCAFTDNVALGNAAGGGFGGAIEDTSSGGLTVTNSTFDANEAVGFGPNNPTTPGYILALGGAIDVSYNSSSTSTISNSTFTGNQAEGGITGASAGGGALSNSSIIGATMSVTNCTLSSNAAVGAAGGDGITNFGSGQGGGINDFSSLNVSNSTLCDNLAQGTPLARGAVPSQTVSSGSASAGGGIFCLPNFVPTATVTVANSTLTGNQAVGGAGAPGSAGSIGEGGGISLIVVPSALVIGCTLTDNVAQGGAGGTNSLGAPGVSGGIDLAFGSVVTVNNSFLIGNEAIGGAGGSGSNGGDGVGGGINVGTGVIYGTTDDCSLTLTNSSLVGNQAVGGAGGSGSNGGNGWGGGVSVLAGSSAAIDATRITLNSAAGGVAGTGGSSGQGIGGGLFIDTGADVTLSKSTKVIFNFASTSDDNIFGTYTIS
jgi:hypothetical protein